MSHRAPQAYWYLPSRHEALLHKPPELPLGQDSVLQVEPAVLVHIGLSYLQLCTEPGVLGVTVVVLGGTEGVCDPLNTVHYRTGKVVGGVHPVWRSKVVRSRVRGQSKREKRSLVLVA